MSQDKSKQDKASAQPSGQAETGKRSMAQPVDALRQGKVVQSDAVVSTEAAQDSSNAKSADQTRADSGTKAPA